MTGITNMTVEPPVSWGHSGGTLRLPAPSRGRGVSSWPGMPTSAQVTAIWLPRVVYLALMLWWGGYVYSFYVTKHARSFLPLLRTLPGGEENLKVARVGLCGGIALFSLCIAVGPGVEGGPAPDAGAWPLHTYHCRRCGRRAQWFDHHCAWMGACIGRRNMRFFLAFAAFHVALCAYGGAMIVFYFQSVVERICGADKAMLVWTRQLLGSGVPTQSMLGFLPSPCRPLLLLINLYLGTTVEDYTAGAMLLTQQLSHQAGSVAAFDGPHEERLMVAVLLRKDNCVINRRMAWYLTFESQYYGTASLVICLVVVLWLGNI
eukprot:COSAG05_NODE_4224_length_1615_cov_1.498021_1_plen_317_part_10